MTIVTAPANIPTATDVASALTTWFASVPNGAIAQLQPVTYSMAGTPHIADKAFLTVDGTGAKFVASTDGTEAVDPRTRAHLRVDRCLTFQLFGLEIQGANPHGGLSDAAYVAELEAQNGVWLDDCVGAELHDMYIHDVFGDFVYIAGTRTGCQHTWVHGVHGTRNGRQGVSVCRGTDTRIEKCVIENVRRSTFDLEPPTKAWTVDGVSIADNCIGSHRLNFLAGKGAGVVNNVDINGNMLHSWMNAEFSTEASGVRRSNFVFRNNVSDSTPFGTPSGRVIKVYGVDGVTVVNNKQPCDAREWRFGEYDFCTGVVDSGNVLT